jgi:hypothetical protein
MYSIVFMSFMGSRQNGHQGGAAALISASFLRNRFTGVAPIFSDQLVAELAYRFHRLAI